MRLVAVHVARRMRRPGGSAGAGRGPDDPRFPGWVTVSTTGAEIQLTLPPWLQVFDNINAIFANEAPAQGENEIPIQLMAVPPGIDVRSLVRGMTSWPGSTPGSMTPARASPS